MSLTLDPPPDQRPSPPHKSWIARYQQHLWMGAISLLAIAIAVTPIAFTGLSRPNVSTVAPPATSLPTNITITASEFKFSPSSIQVPAGQKITFTLDNTGVVQHDVTIQSAGFTLTAQPGKTAMGEFTFDKPGTFDFFCSIPGHKDAGMKGTLSVVEPGAAARVPSMPDIPVMSPSPPAPPPDTKPLPADLKPL